jgi:ferritin-like metal-binding protein YciE
LQARQFATAPTTIPKEQAMKFFSENLRDLHALYVNQLRMMVSMEKQIVQALPTLIENATDEQLKQALQSHLQETEVQVKRVQEILEQSGGETDMTKCKVVHALVDEAENMIQDARGDAVRDAAIIAAAQRVEHYEIAVYGAMRHFAQVLDETKAAELLDRTIKEEGHADHLLTEIASRINPHAKKAA